MTFQDKNLFFSKSNKYVYVYEIFPFIFRYQFFYTHRAKTSMLLSFFTENYLFISIGVQKCQNRQAMGVFRQSSTLLTAYTFGEPKLYTLFSLILWDFEQKKIEKVYRVKKNQFNVRIRRLPNLLSCLIFVIISMSR